MGFEPCTFSIGTLATYLFLGILQFRFAILGKKTVGIRIDRVPDVIVAGVCLFNFALDQGEDPEIPGDDDDDQDDDEPDDGGEQEERAVIGDAAMLAQGEAHRQWLVSHFCN